MYQVIFDPKCLTQLEEQYETLEQFDIAFAETRYSLEKNPYAFKMSPQYPQWIVIITRPFSSQQRVIPSLRMYGAINEDNGVVKIFQVTINTDD